MFAALHIAGTNGKGSVAAMAESILRHTGCKTGLFISPHLLTIRERICVDGCAISPRRFTEVVSAVRRKEIWLLRKGLVDRPLTFFEFITACAFFHFAKERVDVGVIEVGLGGRLDATNILIPGCTVITGVSYDHQNLLGNTLAKIAHEKAGIVKPEVPLISGCRTAVVRRVVRQAARRAKAPLLEIDKDCRIQITGEKQGRFSMNLQTPTAHYRNLCLSLAGKHQVQNAALAVAAVEALRPLRVTLNAVRQGLAAARWPGRLDIYRAHRRTLLDGAHNPEAAQVLAQHLLTLRARELHLVFGVMRDKDIRKIGAILFPLARCIHLTPVTSPRSADPMSIAVLHPKFRSRMRLHPNPRAALRAAWKECPADGWIVVTGSLYLVGELLPLVRAKQK